MANTIPACSDVICHHSWYATHIHLNHSNHIYINLHYKFITPLNSLVDVLRWTFGHLPNSLFFSSCSFCRCCGASSNHLLVKLY